jgi:hypothetical protein
MIEPDNGRGTYAAAGSSSSLAEKHYRYHVAWRHGVSERILIQFMGPNAARAIAASLNFRHVNPKTGEVTRCWDLLKTAWGVRELAPVQNRIILATGGW